MLFHPPRPHSPPQHHATVTRIITQCPAPHPRHNTRPSHTTDYLVEWETITCPYQTAQAHLTRGTPITHIIITPQFATDRPIIPAELDPPCFQCHLGEGDSRDPNLLQCERCFRWIHAHCLPQPTPIDQLILIEGRTCHECDPPTTTNPCPHQLCTIQFAPTPHIKSVIQICPGGKQTLHNFQNIPTTSTQTTHNSPIPICYPTNARQTENTPIRLTTAAKTPYNLKRPIEQDTHTTSSLAPLSKHPRPDNHTTTPNQLQKTTKVFRAGRRRKPPRRTHSILATANNTQNTRTHTQPNNYATHKRTLTFSHTSHAHEQ